MKHGFSILLGEFIHASGIVHKDSEYFQIICPACHEPIFKVERPGEEEVIHYLSHYKREKSLVEECELRVNSLPTEKLEKTNSEAREQRLLFFLQVYQDELLRYFSPKKETMTSFGNSTKDLINVGRCRSTRNTISVSLRKCTNILILRSLPPLQMTM